MSAGLAIKNPPKKNQQNPPNKTQLKVGFIGYFWVLFKNITKSIILLDIIQNRAIIKHPKHI